MASLATAYSSNIQTLFFDDFGKVISEKPTTMLRRVPTRATIAKVEPYPSNPVPIYLQYRGAFVNRPEWFKHNTTGGRSLESKRFYLRKVNHAHDLFMEGRISLERYVEEIVSFIDTTEDVSKVQDATFDFISANAVKLESRTFCPKDSTVRFSTKINTRWKAHRAKAGCYPSPDEQQGQDEATAFYGEWVLSQPQWGDDAIASLKRYKLQYDLATGFRRWKAIGDNRPLNEAILKIAISKARTEMRDAHDADRTFEDIGQEIAITVWAQLNLPEGAPGAFSGGPESLYFWVTKVAIRSGKKALRTNLKKAGTTKLSLMVHQMEDDGELSGELVDNPIIYQGWFRGPRELPDWMTVRQQEICTLMRDGVTEYAAIGQELGMSPSAVESDIRRMRQRNMAEHAQKMLNLQELDAKYDEYRKFNKTK